MNFKYYNVLWYVVIVLSIFSGAKAAIKCWVCRSELDPRCADPFDNSTMRIYNCADEKLEHLPNVKTTMCQKIRQKVDGNWSVIRSCAFSDSPGEGTGSENYCTNKSGMETCTCKDKDGCNSAPVSLTYSMVPYVLGSFATFLFFGLGIL